MYIYVRKGATKKQKEIFLRNQNFISWRVKERLIFAGVLYILSTHVRLQLKGPVPGQLVIELEVILCLVLFKTKKHKLKSIENLK